MKSRKKWHLLLFTIGWATLSCEASTGLPMSLVDKFYTKLAGQNPQFQTAQNSSLQPSQTSAAENMAINLIDTHRKNINTYLKQKLNEESNDDSETGSVMFQQSGKKGPSLREQSKSIAAQLLNQTLPSIAITTPTKKNFFKLLETPFGLWLLGSSNILHHFEAPNLEPIKSNIQKKNDIKASELYKTIIAGQHKSQVMKEYAISQSLELANQLSNQQQARRSASLRLKDSEWKGKIEQASLLELNREMLKVLVEMREELYKSQLEQIKNRLALTIIQEELNQLNESGLMQMKQALDYKIKPPF